MDEQRRTQFDNVARTARLIADLPKFKAVVELADRPTLQPIADDYQRQAGADLLMVSDRRGGLLAMAGEPATDINEEIDRLNHLVNDVLDVARPIRFDPAPADINRVCRNAAAAVGAGDGQAVSLVIAPELPTLVTDAERLRTVLVNLLSNAQHAVEATPGADVRLLTSTPGDGRVAVTIRDNGQGIADEDLARIFDPYFTTRRAGTGLGLAIAKNIIEGLGGSITVVTRPGAGTDFRVELGDTPIRADG
ncbi:MAG: hypothetical protein EXQ54_07065 [Acidobacteria bacterium]|nr:hypothetical protein [Acidobacteriota bacterium]